MSEVQIKQFQVLCIECRTPADVEFWAGSHGDSGYLTISCPNCGVIENVED